MAKLFDFFEIKGLWRRVKYPEDAHYTHFSSDRKVDFDISKETLVSKMSLSLSR